MLASEEQIKLGVHTESDFCQITLLHNYNMLITPLIKEAVCSSQMKSCKERHLEKL